MLTLFSIPKAFRGHIGVIQRNAIQSWMRVHPEIELILFGDDEGTAEAAREFGARHEADVARNEFGSMVLDDVFAKAQKVARHEVLCYVNADIVLMSDFARAVKRVAATRQRFLMVGRRWDVEIGEALAFAGEDWETKLRDLATRHGKKQGPNWIDYFVFSRGLYAADMPAFAIGRTSWDDWLVWKALREGAAVIDASPVVTAVHQNHDYSHHAQGERGAWYGEEAARNLELAGRGRHMRTIADATHVLEAKGLRRNAARYWTATRRRMKAARYGLWFALLDVTRPVRKMVGLRSGFLGRLRG